MCLGDLCNSLNDLDQFHYKEVIENIPDDFTTTTAAPCLAIMNSTQPARNQAAGYTGWNCWMIDRISNCLCIMQNIFLIWLLS